MVCGVRGEGGGFEGGDGCVGDAFFGLSEMFVGIVGSKTRRSKFLWSGL